MKYLTEKIDLDGEVFEVPLVRREPDFGSPYKWAASPFGRSAEYRKNFPAEEVHIVLDLRLDNREWTKRHASSKDYTDYLGSGGEYVYG